MKMEPIVVNLSIDHSGIDLVVEEIRERLHVAAVDRLLEVRQELAATRVDRDAALAKLELANKTIRALTAAGRQWLPGPTTSKASE